MAKIGCFFGLPGEVWLVAISAELYFGLGIARVLILMKTPGAAGNIWITLNNEYMKKAFFLIGFINIIASASGQVTEECTIEKRDFKGYYIIEYKDKELKEHFDEKKSSRMVDFNNQYFIIDRDSFYHAYIKKSIEGELPYVSISSNVSMLQLIYDYVCADNGFIMKKNLENTLKSNYYYKIKGLKRKSFRVKYVEGILYVVKIPKKKFLTFFGKFSPEMLLTEPMTVYALVNITAVKELEENQFKFMKTKKK